MLGLGIVGADYHLSFKFAQVSYGAADESSAGGGAGFTSYLLAYCFLGGMMAMAYHLIGRMMAHRRNIMRACVRVFRLNQTRGQEALAVQFWCLRCRSYPWGHSLDSVLQSEPSPLSPGGQQPHNGVLFLGAGAAGPFISSASSSLDAAALLIEVFTSIC